MMILNDAVVYNGATDGDRCLWLLCESATLVDHKFLSLHRISVR